MEKISKEEIIDWAKLVDKPPHYNQGKFETFDVIIDTLKNQKIEPELAYCHGTIIKYILRMFHKDGPLVNAKKALWFLKKLITLLEESEKK